MARRHAPSRALHSPNSIDRVPSPTPSEATSDAGLLAGRAIVCVRRVQSIVPAQTFAILSELINRRRKRGRAIQNSMVDGSQDSGTDPKRRQSQSADSVVARDVPKEKGERAPSHEHSRDAEGQRNDEPDADFECPE